MNIPDFDKTKANSGMVIQQGPIIKISDFNSDEEIMGYFDNCFDDINFKNQHISGYLTNNC